MLGWESGSRVWIQLWGKPVKQPDQVSSSRAAIVKMWSPNQQRLGTGTWVAQSVERPTSAQVTISQFMSSSPASGSVLTAQSLEPASDFVSLSLPLPCSCALSLNLSLNKINIKKI